LSLEHALDKALDFAMEFYSDGRGNLRYEGLSVFLTNRQGAYKGNKLQSQAALRNQVLRYVSEEMLNCVKQTLSHVLADLLGNRYAGNLGVDMLIYKDNDNGCFGIHPCIEINLRYTMGLMAIRLFENYLDEQAEGLFSIFYEAVPPRAYEQHLRMRNAHPPTFRNGKLLQGYLALCPVTPATHYVAYLLVA
jgi:hypothetical protein